MNVLVDICIIWKVAIFTFLFCHEVLRFWGDMCTSLIWIWNWNYFISWWFALQWLFVCHFSFLLCRYSLELVPLTFNSLSLRFLNFWIRSASTYLLSWLHLNLPRLCLIRLTHHSRCILDHAALHVSEFNIEYGILSITVLFTGGAICPLSSVWTLLRLIHRALNGFIKH